MGWTDELVDGLRREPVAREVPVTEPHRVELPGDDPAPYRSRAHREPASYFLGCQESTSHESLLLKQWETPLTITKTHTQD